MERYWTLRYLAVLPPSSLIDTRGRNVAPLCSMMTVATTRHLVELLLHRDAFHDVAVGHFPADLGQNRQ